MTIKLAISSDHAGYEMKESLKQALGDRVEWIDLGAYSTDSVNYVDFGKALAQTVVSGEAERGIVICGTGIGISIAANRYKGIRAALCMNSTMARLARAHNDANVLALGARTVGMEVALDCVRAFLETAFEGGRHETRIRTLDQDV